MMILLPLRQKGRMLEKASKQASCRVCKTGRSTRKHVVQGSSKKSETESKQSHSFHNTVSSISDSSSNMTGTTSLASMVGSRSVGRIHSFVNAQTRHPGMSTQEGVIRVTVVPIFLQVYWALHSHASRPKRGRQLQLCKGHAAQERFTLVYAGLTHSVARSPSELWQHKTHTDLGWCKSRNLPTTTDPWG
jgi:hypothetical protein